MNETKYIGGILLITVGLSACGGSGDSGTNNRPLNPSPPPANIGNLAPLIDAQNIQIFGDSDIRTNSAIGFSVIPKNNRRIESISWRQLSGPSVNILANNSQTIGFDVPESGNYSLQASVRLNGESVSTDYDVSFSAGTEVQTSNIRLDHTVTELGKVSLHVGHDETKTIQNITWTQLAGPQVQETIEDGDFLFFDAPSVVNDSVIQYRAQLDFSDGTNTSDDVFITVKNVEFDTNGLFYGNGTAITEDMHAYMADSPYKSALERCVYNNNIPNPPTCTFNELPLIGMQSTNPSIDDILDRTLVSHQWMGDRFKDFLENSTSGQDMLYLLRGVTAVVISYDVRPSFYWAATGAIYLDAANFWQTPNERDSLNDQPDFRSDFGSDLQFSMFWRYTKDNDYYPPTRIDKNNRINRSFSDVEATISWLMYHELAHANDFFPPSSWSNISRSTTPLSYFRNNGTSSDTLDRNFPLRSSEMHSLAQVRFRDETPTALERNYRGSDIEGFFVPDISASFYSYLTIREDFATLVERYMMLYRLGAEADVAIIDGRTQSDEPLVVWGQRNRITEDSLEDRTVFAVSRVYPELGNIRNDLRSLNAPILMTPNAGWFENIVLSPQLNRTNDLNNILRLPYSAEYIKQRSKEDSRDIHDGKPSLEK